MRALFLSHMSRQVSATSLSGDMFFVKYRTQWIVFKPPHKWHEHTVKEHEAGPY